MCKIKILAIILLTLTQGLYSQNNVFLLVDNSGNPLNQHSSSYITRAERLEAVTFAKDLIKGNVNKTNYNKWTPSHLNQEIQDIYEGKQRPLIQQGSYFILMPYGDHDRYKEFKISMISNISTDFDKAFNKINSFNYSDQNTFETLAMAKASDIALDQNFTTYYLINISGLGGDHTGSFPYSQDENNFITNYRSGTSMTSCGTFNYSDPNKTFGIAIYKMDISILAKGSNISTTGQTGIVQQPNVLERKIELNGELGTSNKPMIINKNKPVFVSWKCLGCEPEPTFRIIVRGINGNKFNKNYTQKNTFSKSLMLEPGIYRINVSSNGLQSKPLYVKVEGTSGGGFLLLLIILGLVGVGAYYGYKYFFRDNQVRDQVERVEKKTRKKNNSYNEDETDSGFDDNNDYF
jgi:hypothetical protein